jgi:segregation and condensation protein B
MSENNVKSVIEALLFSSDRPLTIDQVRSVLGHMQPSDIRGVIEELKKEYETSRRGMRITEIAGGFQMITATDFAVFLKKLYKERRVERLSRQALETLAIIAYKQPLTRMEIEAIRNVNVDNMITNLAEKNLIRISGRKKAPGRPFVYGTTKQFLEHFGLKSLDELPKIEELAQLAQDKHLEENVGTQEKAEETHEPQESAQKN